MSATPPTLTDALRTTGAVREFTDEVVPLSTVAAILDDARFAPSGGNRQGWHVIVVTDPTARVAVRDCYRAAWREYLAHLTVGLVPFSPVASAEDRARAVAAATTLTGDRDDFAARLHEVPVMLVVSVDLGVLAAVDRDLDRYGICGGASVYPFVWQILLAARARGLGGVMTTMATAHEPELQLALRLPAHQAVASVVALGWPATTVRRLTRRGVAEFTTINAFDGPALSG